MSGWVRRAANCIERDGYRVVKSHIFRLLQEPAPIYRCYAPGDVFIGVVGLSAKRAQARCEAHRAHRTQHEARPS